MAELFQISEMYRMEKENKKKNRRMILILVAILVIGIGLVMTASFFFSNRCYNSCVVDKSITRNDSNNVGYRFFEGNLLKYSRNGISAVSVAGKNLWNGGYEMRQPQIDTCGGYVLVTDVTGKKFYIYNGEDEGTSIETTLPLVRAKVSANGIVAALVEDSDSNVLNIYNPYSPTERLLVEIPTNVSEEGYPLDFDISPDGTSVVVSHLIVTGTEAESRVSFYNFTAVGQDKNTLVGGKSFGGQMISAIEFLDDDKAAVFYEDGFSVFGRMKQPEIIFEKNFGETIRSVAYNEKNIAVVTADSGRENKELHVFSTTGKEVLNRELAYEYSEMKIYDEEIIFTGNHHCKIIRLNGHDKLNCEFEDEVEGLFPTENGSIYTLIDAKAIKTVRLAME